MDDIDLIKIGDNFDLTVEERYAAIRAGIISAIPIISALMTMQNTMSDMHSKKIIKQRLDDYSCKIKANAYLIEQLFIDLNNTVNEQERSNTFFNHKKIIEKFIEDADVLDEELQKNITDYVVNCKGRELYKPIIQFLLNTPTFKINNISNAQFKIKNTVDFNSQVVTYEIENPYIMPLDELRNFGDQNIYRNNILTLNVATTEILYHCLKILNEETCPGIDSFIKDKGWG